MKKVLIAGLIAPIAMFVLSAAPAFASISVHNENDAYVTNNVTVSASTGGNNANATNHDAFGGEGEDGGNGGDASNVGVGGDIHTGNAFAKADVFNNVNRNETTIDQDCECSGSITVHNDNDEANVHNTVHVDASTGSNTANALNHDARGGEGEDGGNGGDASNVGVGGDIHTGNADALAFVTNYVNTNITKIQ